MNDEDAAALQKLAMRVDALRRAMDAVIGGTTPDHGKWGAFKHYARAYNAFAAEYNRVTGTQSVNFYDISRMKGSRNTVWPVQKEIFDTIYADTLILSGLLSGYELGTSASISTIQDLLVANLRKVVFGRPQKEAEVQNAVESLLIGRGYQRSVDYDRETGRVKFSGKEFVPDFVFMPFSLALEIKLIKGQTDISRCVEQMSADAQAYLSVYKTLLFCVYDLGEIRDVNEFQEGLQRQNGIRVCVIKH
jgi:hypothetical protein